MELHSNSNIKQVKDFIIEKWESRNRDEDFKIFKEKIFKIIEKIDSKDLEKLKNNANKVLFKINQELQNIQAWNNGDRLDTIPLAEWKIINEKNKEKQRIKERNEHLRKNGLNHLII